jgi:tRNA(Ile)-lysidine synthase
MTDRVIRCIERHSMFSAGMRIGVAVSGGADSLCLLYLLHEIGPRWNLHLQVIHIDHGIRGEVSKADAQFVQRTAAEFAIPFHLREVQILQNPDNLEQAARNARHDFYRELLASGSVDRIATGHTLSDQAETVLYRLIRGAGLAGLCGILPVTREGLVRPLLDITREETQSWLQEREIEWRDDISNADLRFARNRIRHHVLPMLRSEFNPQIDLTLAHLAVLAQDEEDYWSRLLSSQVKANPAFFNIDDLTAETPALARRKIRGAIDHVKGDLRQVDFAHIETVLEVARSQQGSGRVQLPGLDIYRSFDWIRIAPAGFDSARERQYRFPVNVPGSVTLPYQSGTIHFGIHPRGAHVNITNELDWERLTSFEPDAAGAVGAKSGLLELRNWRPGDQYRPTNVGQSEKIKLLFQEARIPLWERRHWPVLTCNDRIVWSRLFGSAAEFAAGEDSRWILRVTEDGPGRQRANVSPERKPEP